MSLKIECISRIQRDPWTCWMAWHFGKDCTNWAETSKYHRGGGDASTVWFLLWGGQDTSPRGGFRKVEGRQMGGAEGERGREDGKLTRSLAAAPLICSWLWEKMVLFICRFLPYIFPAAFINICHFPGGLDMSGNSFCCITFQYADGGSQIADVNSDLCPASLRYRQHPAQHLGALT